MDFNFILDYFFLTKLGIGMYYIYSKNKKKISAINIIRTVHMKIFNFDQYS